MSSFKVLVRGVGDRPGSEPASNGLRFATAAEAEASGDELASRWSGLASYTVGEADEPVTHRFDFDQYRHVRLDAA
jgi:hypothetical protein